MAWTKDFAAAKPSTKTFSITIGAIAPNDMTHSPTETEIKLAVPGVWTARRLLKAAGFAVSRRRVFESNLVFDTPRLALRRASTLLRLRQAGKLTTVTY